MKNLVISVVPTKKGMNWSAKQMELAEEGEDFECVLVDLLAICCECRINVNLDATIDRVVRRIKWHYKKVYDDDGGVSRKIVSIAFKRGYLRFHLGKEGFRPVYLPKK
jgi:hypothetical protein